MANLCAIRAAGFRGGASRSGGELRLHGRYDRRLGAGDAQHQERGQEASKAAGQKSQEIIARHAAHRAGAKGRQSPTYLVTGEDPGDDNGSVPTAKQFVSQREGRRAGGDPVEAVKYRKDRQATTSN